MKNKHYWISKSDWKTGNYIQNFYNEISNQVQKCIWICLKNYDFPFIDDIMKNHMRTNRNVYFSDMSFIKKIKDIENLLWKVEDDLQIVDYKFRDKKFEIETKISTFKKQLEISNVWKGEKNE